MPSLENTWRHPEKWPVLISIVLLLVAAFGRWPYSFYVLTRLIVCGSAAYLAVGAYRAGKGFWLWVMGGVAVLFNPILPVRMRRHDWQPFDLLAALLFGVYLVVASRREPRV
jgi:hypothetical protein